MDLWGEFEAMIDTLQSAGVQNVKIPTYVILEHFLTVVNICDELKERLNTWLIENTSISNTNTHNETTTKISAVELLSSFLRGRKKIWELQYLQD